MTRKYRDFLIRDKIVAYLWVFLGSIYLIFMNTVLKDDLMGLIFSYIFCILIIFNGAYALGRFDAEEEKP